MFFHREDLQGWPRSKEAKNTTSACFSSVWQWGLGIGSLLKIEGEGVGLLYPRRSRGGWVLRGWEDICAEGCYLFWSFGAVTLTKSFFWLKKCQTRFARVSRKPQLHKFTVWPEIFTWQNLFFSGINFGIALHSLYRKYLWAEIILLYIILTATLKLQLFLLTLHYIKIPEANHFGDALHNGYIKNCFPNLKCNNFRSTGSCCFSIL